jgi:hypothetical protein
MHKSCHLWVVATPVFLAAPLVIAGCGGATDELPRQAVSGKVTLDGQPLKEAMIQFVPAEPGATTAGGSGVVDGNYSISKSEGLVPGKYQVSITSTPPPSPLPPGATPGDPVAPPKELIPVIYNAKTTLSAQVAKDVPNTFNFELKSK